MLSTVTVAVVTSRPSPIVRAVAFAELLRRKANCAVVVSPSSNNEELPQPTSATPKPTLIAMIRTSESKLETDLNITFLLRSEYSRRTFVGRGCTH
jgi:hypothetical protein